jgi:hypothetical protein
MPVCHCWGSMASSATAVALQQEGSWLCQAMITHTAKTTWLCLVG